MDLPIGNAGQSAAADSVRMAELARFEQQRRRPPRRLPPPDPEVLAAGYLEQAGFSRRELETVAPLLAAARKHYVLEKQFHTTPGPTQWTPVVPSP
jgi:hypothetical protein